MIAERQELYHVRVDFIRYSEVSVFSKMNYNNVLFMNIKRLLGFCLCCCFGTQLCAQRVYSLAECRTLALENSKDMKISEESLYQARENRRAAFTAFLPTVNATAMEQWNGRNLSLLGQDALLPVGTKAQDGSFTMTLDQMQTITVGGLKFPVDADGNIFDPRKNPERIQPLQYAYLPKDALTVDMSHVAVLGIGFSQPVFMGGKIAELYRLSKIGEQAALLQSEAQQEGVLIAVDESYWRVVSLENKCKLARQYYALLSHLDSNLTEMIAEGVATKADGLKVRVKLNQAETSLMQAENGLSLSKMFLNQLCGNALEVDFSVPDITPDNSQFLEAKDSVYNVQAIVDNRREIKQLDLAVQAAESQQAIMLSRFFPNIVLTGNYLASNPNMFNGVQHTLDGSFSFGFGVVMPIFHWGERVHTYRSAKSAVRMAQYERDQIREKLELQTTQATMKVNETKKNVLMAKKNVESAEENLRYAQLGFDEGVISITDLTEAQTAWVSSHSQKIDADIDLILAQTYLQKYMGELEIPQNRKK